MRVQGRDSEHHLSREGSWMLARCKGQVVGCGSSGARRGTEENTRKQNKNSRIPHRHSQSRTQSLSAAHGRQFGTYKAIIAGVRCFVPILPRHYQPPEPNSKTQASGNITTPNSRNGSLPLPPTMRGLPQSLSNPPVHTLEIRPGRTTTHPTSSAASNAEYAGRSQSHDGARRHWASFW